MTARPVDAAPLSASADNRIPTESENLLGMEFAALTVDEAARAIAERAATAPFDYVVTPNVDHLVRVMGERRDLLPVYRAAWLRLCDSRVLRFLARWHGIKLQVVAGSDLVAHLFDHFIRPNDAVAIIGCEPLAVRSLSDAYGLMRVSHYVPPMNFIHDPAAVEACVAFIAARRARYVFLAVGSPQQEILAAAIAASGEAVGIGLCAGASINFLVGLEKRAPLWMRLCCLEWLYRLLSNPRRLWWRYLVRGPRIFSLLLRPPRAAHPAL